MSKYLSKKYESLLPYTPGEQPKERSYIKLNTNESPYPPSPRAIELATAEASRNMLYSDPEMRDLRAKMAEYYSVDESSLIMTNGSDEVLNFAFMAFCDESRPAVFADITYGFYRVFAELNSLPYEIIPLREDFSIAIEDYRGKVGTVIIANPNAPTGIALPLEDIRALVEENPDRIVIIDEAYVDFGAKSAVPLTKEYKNLLVTGTFSKSRSMAGARLGFAIGDAELIADLHRLRYSTNPYNVNRMTLAMGVGSLCDEEYFRKNCQSIIDTRERTTAALRSLGFTATPSSANFIFAKHSKISGEELYLKLKENGVLVRHFTQERIKDYNRITVGNPEEMQTLISKIKEIWSDLL